MNSDLMAAGTVSEVASDELTIEHCGIKRFFLKDDNAFG